MRNDEGCDVVVAEIGPRRDEALGIVGREPDGVVPFSIVATDPVADLIRNAKRILP